MQLIERLGFIEINRSIGTRRNMILSCTQGGIIVSYIHQNYRVFVFQFPPNSKTFSALKMSACMLNSYQISAPHVPFLRQNKAAPPCHLHPAILFSTVAKTLLLYTIFKISGFAVTFPTGNLPLGDKGFSYVNLYFKEEM